MEEKMELSKIIELMKANPGKTWDELALLTGHKNGESLRTRMKKKGINRTNTQNFVPKPIPEAKPKPPIVEKLSELERRMFALGVNEKDVLELLQSTKRPTPQIIQQYLGGKKFKFGVVSDTHLGSKFEALNELHTFYKRCIDDGCEFMVNAGDITDGSAAMHKGFLYELNHLGADDQIDHVLNNYPSGIKTYYCQGNHDESHFKQNGTSIAKGLSQRKDLLYCGDVEVDIEINGIIIRLYHGGSVAYAITYPAQKYINAIQGGSKPNIIIFGHLHSAYYLPYRNIHSLGAGCFQWQTRWLRSKGLQPVVGGWIVEVEISNGSIISFDPRFIQFYK